MYQRISIFGKLTLSFFFIPMLSVVGQCQTVNFSGKISNQVPITEPTGTKDNVLSLQTAAAV